MNYRFSNLLGAPYRGGNVVLHGGSQLVTPVGNRISVTDLVQSETTTLPAEHSANVYRIAVSPNGVLLVSVDEEGRSLLINIRRRVVLHHFSFKGKVGALRFSPDGRFVAAGVGKLLQVWRTPGAGKEFAAWQLHRTYGGCHDDITCLNWSPDSQWVVVGSKDLSVRIFSLHPLKGYKPITLTGHRDVLVGVFFCQKKLPGAANPTLGLYTLTRDAALLLWDFIPEAAPALAGAPEPGPEEVREGEEGGERGSEPAGASTDWSETLAVKMHQGVWKLQDKLFFLQNAKLTSTDYHDGLGLLVAGFSSGTFGLYQMPDFQALHLLSISRERISAAAFNEKGDWLALGCAKLGQLLVWEWRSETYVLKQQGHYFDVNSLAYSPDSQLLATGSDDNKLKIWNASSGFCFVTFSEHAMPVTAVAFLPSNHAVLSASLDGTVRAFDLVRYRNFRTFTSPTPVQFASLTIDPAGEVVCAGSLDTFQVYVWSMKTGRLLDVLSGHEGPVHGLSFSPTQELLASSSWDKTVRLWDVFTGKGGVEPLTHTHDVLTVAFRPDGRQLASSTLDGQIHFWDPINSVLEGTVEGRRDIAGGRKMTDRQSAANASAGKCFFSLSFSADGALLLAAGSSKFICIYDTKEKVLLRRFQTTQNRAIDGVLDMLNSKRMTDAGPLDLIDDWDDDVDNDDRQVAANLGQGLPGASANRGRQMARTKCVRVSPSGSSFAAATTEGVLIYSTDDTLVFDPSDLDLDVTPEAIEGALGRKEHARALSLALRLSEPALVRLCIEAVPPTDIPVIVHAVPRHYLAPLVTALATLLETSPHVEFLLRWCEALFVEHSRGVQAKNRQLMPHLRSLQKAMARIHDDLTNSASHNLYLLRYLTSLPPPETPSELPSEDDTLIVPTKKARVLAS